MERETGIEPVTSSLGICHAIVPKGLSLFTEMHQAMARAFSFRKLEPARKNSVVLSSNRFASDCCGEKQHGLKRNERPGQEAPTKVQVTPCHTRLVQTYRNPHPIPNKKNRHR